MIRFTRKGTLKNASYVPKAIGWATELNGYMNTKYDMNVQFGIEMFGSLNMAWYMDADDLATFEAINAKILMDGDYWTMIENAKEFWVDGSLNDTIVNVLG